MALQKCFHNKLQSLKSAHRALRSLGSAVGIAADYGLDDRGVGVRIPVGREIIPYPVTIPAHGSMAFRRPIKTHTCNGDRRDRKLKNIIHLIGYRTRDVLVCSKVL
jgi:hypothetical protein